jgi:hypothetical protein
LVTSGLIRTLRGGNSIRFSTGTTGFGAIGGSLDKTNTFLMGNLYRMKQTRTPQRAQISIQAKILTGSTTTLSRKESVAGMDVGLGIIGK